MFRIRWISIVAIVVGLLVSFVPARAQLPTPGPDGHVPLAIPKEPPPAADPTQWARQRAQCQELADKTAKHQPVDPMVAETMREPCFSMSLSSPAWRAKQHPFGPDIPPPPNQKPIPVPVPAPLSPEEQDQHGEQRSSSLSVGPFGTPFSGGGGSACVTGGQQPIDVAADVSPTQIMQLLNQGIWVFDKQGTVQPGFPKPQKTFWAANSPPPANILTDTQVAYEPLAPRLPASRRCLRSSSTTS
jgi:hypothetical protein